MPQPATACCSTCFWGLLVGFLKHSATDAAACRSGCRSTLKIGLGLFGKKISDQNINPIPEQSSVRDWQSPSGQMLQLQLRSYLCPPTWNTCRALFCGGKGGRSCPGCPGTAPGGGGWSNSTCAAEVAASAPCAPPPEGWGWGSTDVPCSCPPLGGGVRNPRGGGGVNALPCG